MVGMLIFGFFFFVLLLFFGNDVVVGFGYFFIESVVFRFLVLISRSIVLSNEVRGENFEIIIEYFSVFI